jgi:hypothetical protein
MVFDERYMPLLCQANLLAVNNIVHRAMPVFNVTTVTVMVDRWRPETHSLTPCVTNSLIMVFSVLIMHQIHWLIKF